MTGLKDLIKEKYGSEAAFGMQIGFIPQKVSRMLKGEYVPKLSDAQKIAEALDITLDEVANFFAG